MMRYAAGMQVQCVLVVGVLLGGCDDGTKFAPPVACPEFEPEPEPVPAECPEINLDDLRVTCSEYELCTRRCSAIEFGEDARRDCVGGCETPTGVSEDFAEEWGWECASIGHRHRDYDDPDKEYLSPDYLCVTGLETCEVLAES